MQQLLYEMGWPVIEVSSLSWTQQSRCLVSPSPHLRAETDPVSEKFCFLVFIIPDDRQSPEAQEF
jgi:hypothetical protein